jgi:hypothetical protein
MEHGLAKNISTQRLISLGSSNILTTLDYLSDSSFQSEAICQIT